MKKNNNAPDPASASNVSGMNGELALAEPTASSGLSRGKILVPTKGGSKRRVWATGQHLSTQRERLMEEICDSACAVLAEADCEL